MNGIKEIIHTSISKFNNQSNLLTVKDDVHLEEYSFYIHDFTILKDNIILYNRRMSYTSLIQDDEKRKTLFYSTILKDLLGLGIAKLLDLKS